MAYKGNTGRGKGRSSSGRKSSGDDGAKRTWNQRTSHEDFAEDKPVRKSGPDEGTSERKPIRKDDRSAGFSKEKKSYGDRAERKPYARKNDSERRTGDRSESKPFAERDERKPYEGKDNTGRDTAGNRDSETRERKPFADRDERKPFNREDSRPVGEKRERKPYGDRDERKPFVRKPYGDSDARERKPFSDRGERKPFAGDRRDKPFVKEGNSWDKKERKPYSPRGEKKDFVGNDNHDQDEKRERTGFDENTGRAERKPYSDRTERKVFDRKKYEGTGSKGGYTKRDGDRPTYDKRGKGLGFERKPLRKRAERPASSTGLKKEKMVFTFPDGTVREEKLTRLNKYIANSGICSRREADELIKAGLVSVNGVIVTEMGVQVSRTDIVKYNNAAIRKERKIYVLLNKPKDYITTTDDPGERKTVMALVENACKERIYPVGRLDRNTTGLLLVTNDGDLTKKLTHPSSNVKKIYHVELERSLAPADLKKIAAGLELEDGPIKVDEINYDGDGLDKKQVGIAIHSGKNRIVRRIFEHLGYEVIKLDRVIFAGLTKKDLPRGKWRNLSELEVNMLKMIAGTR